MYKTTKRLHSLFGQPFFSRSAHIPFNSKFLSQKESIPQHAIDEIRQQMDEAKVAYLGRSKRQIY